MSASRSPLARMAAMLVAFFVVVVGCDAAFEAATADTAAPMASRSAQARMVAPARERLELPPPPVPVAGDPIQLLDARRMVWNDARFEDAEVGDELRYHNLLYRRTADGLEYVDVASDEALANADAAWDEYAEHTYPDDRDFVYVLGGPPDGGHRRLRYVQPGQRIAFQGRVFEIGSFGPRMTLKPTGDVIARVTNTYKRQAPEVIDATVEYDDGTQDVLTGTPNHPFWVPAVDDYVELSELEIGARLHTAAGTGAILVSKTWRQGDFEVFDIEVEGAHNFYVRGEGSDAAGVLVHNSTAPTIKPGTSGGPPAGQRFPQSVRQEAFDADPTRTCVFCGREGTGTQVDHAVPRARGGDATIDNAQLACKHCNPSKGSGDLPKSPPPDYEGPWPPLHWPAQE